MLPYYLLNSASLFDIKCLHTKSIFILFVIKCVALHFVITKHCTHPLQASTIFKASSFLNAFFAILVEVLRNVGILPQLDTVSQPRRNLLNLHRGENLKSRVLSEFEFSYDLYIHLSQIRMNIFVFFFFGLILWQKGKLKFQSLEEHTSHS
jgi:hypothetical protein